MEQSQKILQVEKIFNNDYMDSRAFYMYCYHQPPSVTWIGHIYVEKAIDFIKHEYRDSIIGIYQYAKYHRRKEKSALHQTIILLNDQRMLELRGEYCEMLHKHDDYEMARVFLESLSRFKRRERKRRFESNLIMKYGHGLDLKNMEIKKTKLDLGMYYEDDFIEVDQTIIKRLGRQDDNGVVLLHGLPGTGKTTYLRYLIGQLKKKVMFLSSSEAASIQNPEFMELLIDNPNSILIIEDAESVIADRSINNHSCVSGLLNVSDGMLADFLKVQIICTFNSPIALIDKALLRKGRLIARYEFGKLSIEKAQRLSQHLGFDTEIRRPMTIAEIANQHEKENKQDRVQVIGFRRQLIEN